MEDHFVPIYDWMLELGLKPGELIAFAVIYSFWKKDGGWFHGSASYLAKCIGVKKNETVYKTLASLVKKGMVEKRERWEKGEKFCDYQPVRKTDGGRPENGVGTSPKNGHHYNRPDYTKDYKKEINNKEIHLSVEEFLSRRK